MNEDSYNPFPFPQPNNPFHDQSQESGAKIQAELRDTMRSFRDSLAFSFQTLNLTLASLNNSVRSVGAKLSQLNGPNAGQYLPANLPGANIYYGSMSRSYADFMGNRNILGVFTADQPYNVNPLEFWREKQTEEATRLGGAATSFSVSAAEELATTGSAIYGGSAIAGMLGMGGSTIAKFAFGMPVAMAVGQLAAMYADPLVASAQEHSRDVAAIKRMSGRFSSPFTIRQAQDATRGIERLAYEEIFNTNRLEPRLNLSGYRDITMMGLQADMFKGTTPEELVDQVASASRVVKFLTGVLGNKDVRETMEVVKQLKNMGINLFKEPGMAATLGNDLFGYSRVMGIDTSTMLNMAGNMSTAAFGQYGNPAAIGMQPAMRNLAYVSEMEKRGMLSSAEVNAAGGVQAVGARMLEVQARMLNAPGTGDALLLAGWNGGRGFSMDNWRANSRGGYFDTVGAAAGNFFRNGIAGMAGFMVNKSNIMADMANQGNLGDFLDDILEQQLPLIPGFSGGTTNDRVNIAAWFLMEHYGVDAATAKATAMRVVAPSTERALSRGKNREIQIGELERTRARHAPSRVFESIGEDWERLKSATYEHLVRRPGAAISDMFINWFDDTYESQNYVPQSPVTAANLAAYRHSAEIMRSIDPEGVRSGFREGVSAEQLATAIENLGKTDTLGYSAARFVNMGFGTKQNTLDDIVYANTAFAHRDLWQRISSNDRLTTTEVVNNLNKSRVIRAGISAHDMREYFDENYEATAPNQAINTAAGFIYDNLAEGSGMMDLTARIKRTGSVLDKVAPSMMSKDYLNSLVGVRGLSLETLSPDAAFTLLNTPETKATINSRLQAAGAGGVSAEEYLGVALERITGKSSKLTRVAAGGQYANADMVAEAATPGDQIGTFANIADASQIRLGFDRYARASSELGLDRLFASKISHVDSHQMDAFASALEQHATTGKIDKYTLGKITDKELHKYISKMVENDPTGKDTLDALTMAAPLTDPNRDISKAVRGVVYSPQLEMGVEHVSGMLSDLGLDNSRESTLEVISGSGSLADKILKMKSKNAEVMSLQRNISAFQEHSVERQNSTLKEILGKAEFNNIFGNDGINSEEERKKAANLYALNIAQLTDAQKTTVRNEATNNIKSAVDATVDTRGSARPYLRIKDIDSEINREREYLEYKATFMQPTGRVSESGDKLLKDFFGDMHLSHA